MKEKVLASIYGAIDQLNLENKSNIPLAKSQNTILFGKSGQLDSLGLINLIVTTEGRIEEDFGQVIMLSDDRALSQPVSPFQTIETLANYIVFLLQEKANG